MPWSWEKVYPVGVPSLYLFILWANRDSLNPSLKARSKSGGTEEKQGNETAGGLETDLSPESSGWVWTGRGGSVKVMTLQESQELEKRINDRRTNPDLAPSMFLWKDFGETFSCAATHAYGGAVVELVVWRVCPHPA